MNEETETKTRKKNGAHTNSCTTVQLAKRNIHVSCCLFSHHQNNNQTKNYKRFALLWTSYCLIVETRCKVFLCKIAIVSKIKRKNGAHTHVRTTVQLMNAIFTSVVVYSRTTQSLPQQKAQVVCYASCSCTIVEVNRVIIIF